MAVANEVNFHSPVLLNESIEYLFSSPNGIYVDGTVGGGGHAEALLRKCDSRAKLYAFDLDEDAIRIASERLSKFGSRCEFIHENFSLMVSALNARQIYAVDGILLDLGVSSFQLDEASRGFSFRSSERLDMRMNRQQALDAFQIVNEYSEQSLAEIFWKYGEERNSRRIAKTLVQKRAIHPIVTTGDLEKVIRQAVGGRFIVKTLARIFQAIRIAVNNELENLQQALHDGIELLKPNGRIVVLSYHSLEDRIVKQVFREYASPLQISDGGAAKLRESQITLLTKKPIQASEEEVKRNPRARSAKLRAAEKR